MTNIKNSPNLLISDYNGFDKVDTFKYLGKVIQTNGLDSQ